MVFDQFLTRIRNFGPKWDTSLTHKGTEPLLLLKDNLLLDLVLDIAVHLVTFFGLLGGGVILTFLLLVLEHSFMLKSYET